MSIHRPPTCPACDSADCRRSRWRSHEEHASHPGLHPWRCLACDQRFLAPDTALRPKRTWPLVVGTMAVLLVLAIAVGAMLILTSELPGMIFAPDLGLRLSSMVGLVLLATTIVLLLRPVGNVQRVSGEASLGAGQATTARVE